MPGECKAGNHGEDDEGWMSVEDFHRGEASEVQSGDEREQQRENKTNEGGDGDAECRETSVCGAYFIFVKACSISESYTGCSE